MLWPTIAATIGGLVGFIGGICGILSWINQRKQTAVMQDQLNVMRNQFELTSQQEGSAVEWALKFDQAADALVKIAPLFISTGSSKTMYGYDYIFPEGDLRRRIERYLGRHRRFFPAFRPVVPTKEQLQNPVIQKTIQEVLETIGRFKTEHTDFARALKLLPSK